MAHRWHSHRRLGSSEVNRLPPERGVRAESVTVHQVISYLAALLAAVINAASNALNRKAAREAPGRDQFRLRLISPQLQADGTGPEGIQGGPRERPVAAAGRR